MNCKDEANNIISYTERVLLLCLSRSLVTGG